jgi:hypothetical protein
MNVSSKAKELGVVVLQGAGSISPDHFSGHAAVFDGGRCRDWVAVATLGAMTAPLTDRNAPDWGSKRFRTVWDRICSTTGELTQAKNDAIRHRHRPERALLPLSRCPRLIQTPPSTARTWGPRLNL